MRPVIPPGNRIGHHRFSNAARRFIRSYFQKRQRCRPFMPDQNVDYFLRNIPDWIWCQLVLLYEVYTHRMNVWKFIPLIKRLFRYDAKVLEPITIRHPYVILNGAQRSEESLYHSTAVRFFAALRMTKSFLTGHQTFLVNVLSKKLDKRAVVIFPDFIFSRSMFRDFNIVNVFDYYVHRSMTKKIVVLEKL